MPSSPPHTRATPSAPAVTRSDPSRENATSTAWCRLLDHADGTTVPPPDPERAVQPDRSRSSRRDATATARPAAVWRPTSERIGSTAGFQTRAEPSSLAVTTLCPSAVNVASSTSPECPCSCGRACEAVPAPDARRPSREAVTIDVPSGLNPTPTTWFECPPRNVTSVAGVGPEDPAAVVRVRRRQQGCRSATRRRRARRRCGRACARVFRPGRPRSRRRRRARRSRRDPPRGEGRSHDQPRLVSTIGARPQARVS